MPDRTRRAPWVYPMTPDPREEKLPVWAAALERLRSTVTAERRRADEARLSGGPEDTDTILNRRRRS